MMKKILLIAIEEVSNPQTWSMTPWAIWTSIKRYKDELTLAYTDHPLFNIIKFYNRIYNHFLFGDEYIGKIFCYPLFSYFIKKKIIQNKKSIDCVIFMASSHCLNKKYPRDIKYATYLDCDHNLLYKYQSHKLGKRMYLYLYNKYTKRSLLQMNYIFTLNEWTKISIIERYKLNPNTIYNIGVGINLEFYNGVKNYKNQLLLIVLREETEHRKGLPLLLDSFILLRNRIPGVKLAVVGSYEKKHIDGVSYYYKKDREVTKQLFKEATLFVMPAKYEPNGTTYLEALANKTPIVGVDRFAFPEFSGYGQWGFILKDETPEGLSTLLHKALSNEDVLIKMGVNGQKFVKERYSWDTVVDKMYNIIYKEK